MVNSSPKLEFYKTVKSDFCFEKYLQINNSSHRNALTRLRISSHNLYIERGRYVNPHLPRNERTCIFCLVHLNIRTVESELHVINDCPLFKDNHLTIQTAYPRVNDNFTLLFEKNDNGHESNSKLDKFVYLILEKHRIFNDLYKSNSLDSPHLSLGRCIIL